MFKYVISSLLFYLIYLLPFIQSKINSDDMIMFQQKKFQQQQNLQIFQINLSVDGKQIDNKTQGKYINIILDLQDPIFSNIPQNNDIPSMSQEDCKNISCLSNVYLAIIYSFNMDELQTIYQNFQSTNNLPLFDYRSRMDYNAFLKQKKSHQILIPTNSIKDNTIKISIGIFNIASKVGITNNQNQISFFYDISLKQITKNSNECLANCNLDSSSCNTHTQKCVCFENYFDLDCSLSALVFSNQLVFNQSNNSNRSFSSSSFYVSSDENLSRTFNQEIQQINPGQWIYYYWIIDSNQFLLTQQNDSNSSSNNIKQFDIFLTFDKTMFKDISLSFIYYGQYEIYVPNIFLNYSKISQINQDANNLLQSQQDSDKNNSSMNQVSIKISNIDLLNYITMYKKNKLIDTLNVDAAIIFGFKNEGKTKTPQNLKYQTTIQYKKDTTVKQSTNSTINKNMANVDVSESQQKDSYIIIISCISIVFFLAILIFLFRKKLCPHRYLSENKSQQGLNKRSPSNISIAAETNSRKRVESNSIRIQSSSFNHFPKQNQLLNGNNQISSNQPSQQFITSIIQQQLQSQSRINNSSKLIQKASSLKVQNNSLGQNGQNLQYPATTCTCTINNISQTKMVQGGGQTMLNLQSSFQNLIGDKTYQHISKSNNILEEMLENDQNLKQQQQQGTQTKRIYEQISLNSLQNINGPQTVSQLNQLTTQINTDRKPLNEENNKQIISQAHLNVECEQCINKRKKLDQEIKLNQKTLQQQQFEVLEEDEAAIVSNEYQANKFDKLNKNHMFESASQLKLKENDQQKQEDFEKLKPIYQIQKQESEVNYNSSTYKQNFLQKINANTNNFLFEQFILHGPVVFKEKWRKNQHKNNTKKKKQRINYKLNEKSKMKKLKRKKNRVSEELEEEMINNNLDNFSQTFKNTLRKINKGKNASITSSYFSQQHLKNSTSSRMVSSNRSIRKVQNGTKGVVSRFFQAQKKPNSLNSLKLHHQKQFGSFDLDVSSIQKKIKLAESIFTGLNPSSNNISMDGSKLKSYQTLDILEQNNKVKSIYENNSPPKLATNPSIHKKKLLRDFSKNDEMNSKNDEIFSKNDITISNTESKYSGSILNLKNNNLQVPKGNQTPRIGMSFGSPQHSFGIQTLILTDANFFKLGSQETDPNRLNVHDQVNKGLLLPSYNLQNSKRSEDLSTPGFLKTRQQNQNSNSKPSVFFHQKFGSPQRSSVNDDSQQQDDEEKCFKSNQKQFFETKNFITNQERRNSSFDLNSSGNKDIDNKMNQLSNSNLETTIIKNSSIDEDIHRHPTFNYKQFDIKRITPNKLTRNEELVTNSFDNEQIQVNRICFNEESQFHLRKIRSLNNYDHPNSQQSQIHMHKQQKDVKQELKSLNLLNTISQKEQQSTQQTKTPALFCQNGFLFTNTATNKLIYENSKINPFFCSLSEISRSNITVTSTNHKNNHMLDIEDKYIQSSTQFD